MNMFDKDDVGGEKNTWKRFKWDGKLVLAGL